MQDYNVCLGISMLDCLCIRCWEARRIRIQKQVARIEARLDPWEIERITKSDDESWYILFFRARCIWDATVENHNSTKKTVRPPRMEIGAST